MKYKEAPALQVVEWKDVRDDVSALNKELAAIIDKISPDKRYKLTKATYNYGDLVVKDGVTYLPSNNSNESFLPVSSLNCDLKDKLSYSPIPLALTLKNANEVFLDTGSRAVPLNIFRSGDMFGLFESMDFIFKRPTLPKWSVSAGARSIFVLPKITEAGGFNRLRLEYSLPSTLNIKELSHHWYLFKAIANHQSFRQEWRNEVLFFSKEWLENSHDPAWFDFYHYLMKRAWRQAQFAIGKIDIGINWEYFTELVTARNFKPTLYITDQIKHIMYLASGMWPGFRPVDNSQQVAPTRSLQEAIINIYQLKNYLPTIMYADLLNSKSKLPVYYSLFHPILLEGSAKSNSSSTIMLNLREIKMLLDVFKKNYTAQPKFDMDFIKKAEFEFFHVEPDKFNEIKTSLLIPQEDEAFLSEQKIYKGRAFCSTSSFWRGCIKISYI